MKVRAAACGLGQHSRSSAELTWRTAREEDAMNASAAAAPVSERLAFFTNTEAGIKLAQAFECCYLEHSQRGAIEVEIFFFWAMLAR